MRYVVKKPFKQDGVSINPGDIVDLDRTRANQLRQYGFIGRPVETAKKEPGERAVKPKPIHKTRKKD